VLGDKCAVIYLNKRGVLMNPSIVAAFLVIFIAAIGVSSKKKKD
jgi:hypothetical protein